MNKSLIGYPVVILFIILFTLTASAEYSIKEGELLGLKKCIEIALENHPAVKSSESGLFSAESRVFQAKSDYYPQVEFSAGYSRVSDRLSHDGSTGLYSSGIGLRQNIYDFGRTSGSLGIRRLNMQASRLDLDDVKVQTAYRVRLAYYGLFLARNKKSVSGEEVMQYRRHLDKAKGFYEVGLKPKFDVTRAEVALKEAELKLLTAVNSQKTAFLKLIDSMGLTNVPAFEIEDKLILDDYGMSLNDAVEAALDFRPDLKSSMERRKSAEASLGLIKRNRLPVFSGSASYSWSGEDIPLEGGWNAGVTLSVPVFDGFFTKNQIEEASYNLKAADEDIRAKRQSVMLEVEEAYLNMNEARERISATELIVRQAEESLELANQRYASGVGSPIEVMDASVSLSNAKSGHVQALADYQLSLAALQKATGRIY